MEKRVCVFVDGENFRYTINSMFDNFQQHDYLPKGASWDSFFDWLSGEISNGGERVRTYWYVIQNIDFYPGYLPDVYADQAKLEEILFRDQNTRNRISCLQNQDRIDKLKTNRTTLLERKQRMTNRKDGWTLVQNTISIKNTAIEFRRAGAIGYNLFNKKLGKEKAVDVKLAVDLIMLRDNYDIATIVSGDQDYVAAVGALKDSGKRVVNVSFETKDGKLLPGGAKRLNMVTDDRLVVKYDKLSSFLNVT